MRNLARLVGGWMAMAASVGLLVAHFDDVRSVLGLKLTAEDLGISASEPAEPQTREVIRYVEREGPPERQKGRQRAGAQQRDQGELFNQQVQLRSDARGHFYANAIVNGRSTQIRTMVDTGASLVFLTYEDAETAGVRPTQADFRFIAQTANGQAQIAMVRLSELRIGPISVRDVDAAVSMPGRLGTTLLGMSFLNRVRFESRGGLLTLEQ